MGIASLNVSTRAFNFYYIGFGSRFFSILMQFLAYLSALDLISLASMAENYVLSQPSFISYHSLSDLHMSDLNVICSLNSSRFSKAS